MNDTSPEMAEKIRKLFMQRSGAERVCMGCEMFSTARIIMTAGLEAQGYRGMELRKQIFLRTYGQDFTPEALDKICRALFPSENSTQERGSEKKSE
ncbi:MAG: hypothetical protein GY862_04990 [Gammaproteobacteria bacterium]|nr:hypothetical protein [Gammaproteobacteria bacterium]